MNITKVVNRIDKECIQHDPRVFDTGAEELINSK